MSDDIGGFASLSSEVGGVLPRGPDGSERLPDLVEISAVPYAYPSFCSVATCENAIGPPVFLLKRIVPNPTTSPTPLRLQHLQAKDVVLLYKHAPMCSCGVPSQPPMMVRSRYKNGVGKFDGDRDIFELSLTDCARR